MERYCLTGQSPQRAVAPTEEEEVCVYCGLPNQGRRDGLGCRACVGEQKCVQVFGGEH